MVCWIHEFEKVLISFPGRVKTASKACLGSQLRHAWGNRKSYRATVRSVLSHHTAQAGVFVKALQFWAFAKRRLERNLAASITPIWTTRWWRNRWTQFRFQITAVAKQNVGRPLRHQTRLYVLDFLSSMSIIPSWFKNTMLTSHSTERWIGGKNYTVQQSV